MDWLNYHHLLYFWVVARGHHCPCLRSTASALEAVSVCPRICGQIFVIPTSAEAALTDTMLVSPMMF